ncbi:MAG: hypothetical protein QM669_10310 [Siphonobacter sp.]
MNPEINLPYPVRLAAILLCILLIIYGLYVLQSIITLMLFSLLLAIYASDIWKEHHFPE